MQNYLAILFNKFVVRPYVRGKLKRVGANFRLGYASTVLNPGQFSFGDDFFSGPYCYFSTNQRTSIDIGNSVMFGPDCKVIGGNHNTQWLGGHMMYAPNNQDDKGIVIEDGVWVGARSLILDGAHVSEGVVVAAGSIVIGYVPPYVKVMGVPAKKFVPRFNASDLGTILSNINGKYQLEDVLQIYRKYNISL